MEWAESDDVGDIFGFAGNSKLKALVQEAADRLRYRHALGSEAKMRTYASFSYRAKSWSKPRRIIARLEAALLPGVDGMRQEVDIRYCVTSLEGSAQHLYEKVYCKRGQAENLIKMHKAQMASDRTSCRSPTANQVRLVLHTAAYWIMHTLRAAVPPKSPLAAADFGTIRLHLIKIAARVVEYGHRIRVFLPTACPERVTFRAVAEGLMPAGP